MHTSGVCSLCPPRVRLYLFPRYEMSAMTSQTTAGVAGKKRVLLVDDYAVVRKGLTCVINAEPDLVVCGEAGDESQALAAARELQPDVAVVDWCLGKGVSSELISTLSHQQPPVPVLVLSIYDEKLYAEQAIRAGASAYVMKHEATDKLVNAIRSVAANASPATQGTVPGFAPTASDGRATNKTALMDSLTEAEKEALRLIADGHSLSRIAQRFGLRLQDFVTLQESLRTKLRLSSTTELFQTAPQWMVASLHADRKR